ncbi:MAG: alpha/beta fold hydrolase, partial [Anaerolineales bacterium]
EVADCPFDLPLEAPVRCGFVNVPDDHQNPGGETIRLALVIVEDQSPEHQPDPVILLSGGPGEEVVANALNLAPILDSLHPNRDLIIFDQRGVGLSEPNLDCPTWEQLQYDLLDEPDPEVAMRASYQSIMTCRNRLLEQDLDLSAYNTTQNAADVEAIRLALGYDQVNLYGASYGSLLAQAVMREHPEGIRSVIIASVLPFEKSIFVDSALTTSNAVLELLAACENDPKCSSAYPDLQDKLFTIIDRLNAEPESITVTHPLDQTTYEAVLTGDSVFSNLVGFLYQTQVIPALPQAIFDVYNGDYELMTQLRGVNLLFIEALSRGMEFSVLCAEDMVGRSPEEVQEQIETLPEQLQGNVDFDTVVEYGIFGICENWPVEEVDPSFKEPLVSDIPTLILEGEFDPVTPSEYGQVVAKHLENSYFFEFPGIGHNITVASECARQITGDFIEDPTQSPNAACIDEMPGIVFDLPSETSEIVLEIYIDENRGFKGLIPSGWEELAPANLLRGSSALDPAYFVLEAQPGNARDMIANLAAQLELDPDLEPISIAELGNFNWYFYSFERRGYPADLALTEEAGKVFFVFLLSPQDEHTTLYEGLFLPAVEAMANLE